MNGSEALFYIYLLAGASAAVFLATVVGILVVTQRKQVDQARRFSQGLVDAQEAERARIARDLHDDVIQRVALIGGELSALGRMIPDPAPPVVQRIEGLREELHDLADEVRGLARRTHPAILDHLGLVNALRSLATDMNVSDDLEVVVEAPPDDRFDRLPAAAGLVLYRIAQEGLRNVARHSGVLQARLALAQSDDEVTLTIDDRGRGLPRDYRAGQGIGLVGLSERLRAVQGTLTISSEDGGGTQLTARIPTGGNHR